MALSLRSSVVASSSVLTSATIAGMSSSLTGVPSGCRPMAICSVESSIGPMAAPSCSRRLHAALDLQPLEGRPLRRADSGVDPVGREVVPELLAPPARDADGLAAAVGEDLQLLAV